jgi:phospholipase C
MPGVNDIDLIVVVMMENRSFDNVFGALHHPAYGNRRHIDGLDDPAQTTNYDNFYQNKVYKPFPLTDVPLLHDLPHDRNSIATQLAFQNGQATMSGFVEAYASATHSVVRDPPPMGFIAPDSVKTSTFLANEFLVCNRWFAPLPAGTQPNRAVAFTGNTLIDNNVTGIIPHAGLVLDWLTQNNATWRVYHSGLSFFLLFGTPHAMGSNFRSIRDLPADLQKKSVPDVIFIEPEYFDAPVHMGFTPNDDHPPLPMGPGQTFLHMIYSSIVSVKGLWEKTLLIVTYDEHGGFYDHVEPEPIQMAPPPGAQYVNAFTTTGVRVPTVIASPWVPRGGVSNAIFDHTSILQLFGEKFAGGAQNYSADVTNRRNQGIQNISSVLTLPKAREDLPLAPAGPIEATTVFRGGAKRAFGEHQIAFAAAARTALAQNGARALKNFPELALLRT